VGNLKLRDHLGGVRVDGSTLKLILEKQNVRIWTRLA
jgi:hypothetical protein